MVRPVRGVRCRQRTNSAVYDDLRNARIAEAAIHLFGGPKRAVLGQASKAITEHFIAAWRCSSRSLKSPVDEPVRPGVVLGLVRSLLTIVFVRFRLPDVIRQQKRFRALTCDLLSAVIGTGSPTGDAYTKFRVGIPSIWTFSSFFFDLRFVSLAIIHLTLAIVSTSAWVQAVQHA